MFLMSGSCLLGVFFSMIMTMTRKFPCVFSMFLSFPSDRHYSFFCCSQKMLEKFAQNLTTAVISTWKTGITVLLWETKAQIS